MYLAHYNQNHDPKTGKFAKGTKTTYHYGVQLPNGKTAVKVRVPAWAGRAEAKQARMAGRMFGGKYMKALDNAYKKVGFKDGNPYYIEVGKEYVNKKKR